MEAPMMVDVWFGLRLEADADGPRYVLSCYDTEAEAEAECGPANVDHWQFDIPEGFDLTAVLTEAVAEAAKVEWEALRPA
jgi:hypothetical protein